MAQDTQVFTCGEYYRPAVIVLTTNQNKEVLIKKINQIVLQNSYKMHFAFIIIDGMKDMEIANEVNDILNNQHWFNKQQIYLLLIESKTSKKILNTCSLNIFADTLSISQSGI